MLSSLKRHATNASFYWLCSSKSIQLWRRVVRLCLNNHVAGKNPKCFVMFSYICVVLVRAQFVQTEERYLLITNRRSVSQPSLINIPFIDTLESVSWFQLTFSVWPNFSSYQYLRGYTPLLWFNAEVRGRITCCDGEHQCWVCGYSRQGMRKWIQSIMICIKNHSRGHKCELSSTAWYNVQGHRNTKFAAKIKNHIKFYARKYYPFAGYGELPEPGCLHGASVNSACMQE